MCVNTPAGTPCSSPRTACLTSTSCRKRNGVEGQLSGTETQGQVKRGRMGDAKHIPAQAQGTLLISLLGT
jgi:hypothetical protein